MADADLKRERRELVVALKHALKRWNTGKPSWDDEWMMLARLHDKHCEPYERLL